VGDIVAGALGPVRDRPTAAGPGRQLPDRWPSLTNMRPDGGVTITECNNQPVINWLQHARLGEWQGICLDAAAEAEQK